MAKTSAAAPRPTYRCAECGWTATKWVGRCGECQAWGTVEEVGAVRLHQVAAGPVSAPARPIAEIDVESARARSTGVGELDRVLGGGLVPGAVVLLAGEPGVGKSTLLLEVAASPRPPARRPGAVRHRRGVGRPGAAAGRADRGARRAAAASRPRPTWPPCSATSTRCGRDLLVLDSVQTVASAEVDGSAGGVTQVREVAAALIRVAKERAMATVLVGHVTKDGSIAGPRVLEHLVDVVLHFEGERHLPAAHGPGREEPLRPLRRGRLLRPARGRHRAGCRIRAGCSCPAGPSRCPAPA